MSTSLSPRLARIVEALPIRSDSRVLEIGSGPGAAARAVAERLETGFVLAIDRSPKAIGQLRSAGADLVASGRLRWRISAIEDLVLEPDEDQFDFAFANRVGALDGRHPALEAAALRAIHSALVDGGELYVDGVRRTLPSF